MDEQALERMLAHDFSEETAEFREDLLNRCLDALDDEVGEAPLDDDFLELISAAGDPSLLPGDKPE